MSTNMMRVYQLRVTFTEKMLGHAPANPEVYKQFIQGKVREEAEAKGDEVETLPSGEREQTGWSVFHEDQQGLLIFDYMVRGVFKAAAEAVTGTQGLSAYRSKIDKWLFVMPRRIYLTRDNQNIMKADDVFERPIRAMTPQGPRVSLKRSDCLNEGFNLECKLHVMPLGRRELNETRLRSWLDYGQWGSGFGEWRSGGFGRFTYELECIEGGEESNEPEPETKAEQKKREKKEKAARRSTQSPAEQNLQANPVRH